MGFSNMIIAAAKSFLDIFFLLHNEHVVVKELLELFVDEVDGDLFETVVLKDLKSCNVQHSAEISLLKRGIN